MIEITELMARNYSMRELAQLLRDHPDMAVRVFIQRWLDSLELHGK